MSKPHFHVSSRASNISYTPPQVASLYGLPSNLDGSGVTVGIVELGGAFSQTDFADYLQGLEVPVAPVTAVNVAGGSQQSDPGGANVEVMLDAEIVAAIAPGCSIRMYFAANTSAGFAAAVKQAASECDVVSVSWGGPEDQWAAADRQTMDAALQAAVAAGVNVYVAAGDSGADDGEGNPVTDYPASSPYAVGCGGTSLPSAGEEVVWDDDPSDDATGGGFSKVYPLPAYQQGIVANTMRGVPDVAGVADPNTGWLIRADGQQQVVGGTSAVAPLWAAINALMIQANGGKRFDAHTSFYGNPQAFNDITSGSNGSYDAGPGWDACTGLGSPNGAALFSIVVNAPTPTPTPIPTPTPTPPPTPTPTPVPTPPPPPKPSRPRQLACLDAHGNVLATTRWHPWYAVLFGGHQLETSPGGHVHFHFHGDSHV